MTMQTDATAAPVNGTATIPTTAALVTTGGADEPGRAISAFGSESNYLAAVRIAKGLGQSTLIPQAYQGNVPNILIAMEMANRIGMSVFMVMQSLDVIHGRPSWSSKFLIATVNACGRFSPLRFRFSGNEGTDDWGCRAVAKERESGEECVGPLVSIAMAKAEGWYAKNGSKWKTLPELMLMYRAGGFWTRVYAPELSLGIQTTEEAQDTWGAAQTVAGTVTPSQVMPGDAKALEATLLGQREAAVVPAEPVSTREPGED